MFLSFLAALLCVLGLIDGRKKFGYASWITLLVVTTLWFGYHARTPLNLSF
jgi:hypothetical protein